MNTEYKDRKNQTIRIMEQEYFVAINRINLVNDDDYDSAGPIKQTDESSSSSSTASHDDDEPPSTNVGKAVVKQQNGECHSRQITRSIDIQKKNVSLLILTHLV